MSILQNLDPTVQSAVIAALTSLIIAGVSGAYVLISTRKRTEKIRDDIIAETMAKMSVEEFHSDLRKYRSSYSDFSSKALAVSNNMTVLFPLMFDFYRDVARLFIVRQENFVPKELFDKINVTDIALEDILRRKEKGDLIAPEKLANQAYKGMKSVIEGLAEL